MFPELLSNLGCFRYPFVDYIALFGWKVSAGLGDDTSGS